MSNAAPSDWTEPFSDCLARAESGDVIAARDALHTIAVLLATNNVHPQTGEPLPVPPNVRNYLARALSRMAAGVDANKAFHLKKPGPRAWSHDDKLRGAAMVAALVKEASMAVDAATAEAAHQLESLQAERKADPLGRPVPMRGRKVSAETLRGWYFELKDELAQRGL
ncbi:MAG: hypothetical protein KGN16_10405 [Burkholderiales bacterium]|nr:hypothetical protein [Burkholderiales bacterium]